MIACAASLVPIHASKIGNGQVIARPITPGVAVPRFREVRGAGCADHRADRRHHRSHQPASVSVPISPQTIAVHGPDRTAIGCF